MFGWDWGPRLPDCGIWREIELLGCSSGIITVEVLQDHEADRVTLHLNP